MEFVAEWVQNIAYYMIFMTVILSLLPAKQYEKYVRFFAGIVLILLVIKPFLGGLHLEQELSHFYQEFSLKQDTAELKQKILGVEQQQKQMLLSQYETAVKEDIRQMATSGGFAVEEVRVSVCENEKTEDFGKVEKVMLRVRYVGIGMRDAVETGKGVETRKEAKRAEEAETTKKAETTKETEEKEREERKETGSVWEASAGSGMRESGRRAANQLRERIAEYYRLEVSYVEIQLEEG